MKCAIFRGPGDIEIAERPDPVPAAGQVAVRIMAAGICGSDLGPWQGRELERRQPGIVMGHEASGIVDSVGPGVTAWQPGDRVAINPQIYCGHCRYCLSGNRNLCDSMLLIGSSKRKFLDGAMCELLCIGERQLLRLPPTVGFDEGSMLDPAGNAFRAVRQGAVGIGDTVLVIGCGTIGLIVVQTARLAGAARVIAVDRNRYKLDLALELGADACVETGGDFAARTAAAALADAEAQLAACAGNRGIDVAINAAGPPDTYALAVRACRKGGTIVALGYTGSSIEIPMTELIFKEQHLAGTTGFSEESRMVLDYLARGAIRLNPIITDTIPLAETASGFERLLRPGKTSIKVIIHPNPPSPGD